MNELGTTYEGLPKVIEWMEANRVDNAAILGFLCGYWGIYPAQSGTKPVEMNAHMVERGDVSDRDEYFGGGLTVYWSSGTESDGPLLEFEMPDYEGGSTDRILSLTQARALMEWLARTIPPAA